MQLGKNWTSSLFKYSCQDKIIFKSIYFSGAQFRPWSLTNWLRKYSHDREICEDEVIFHSSFMLFGMCEER